MLDEFRSFDTDMYERFFDPNGPQSWLEAEGTWGAIQYNTQESIITLLEETFPEYFRKYKKEAYDREKDGMGAREYRTEDQF